jgi:endonuclease-3
MTKLTEQEIGTIFNILSQHNPIIKTELNFNNNFTLLIAVVLSAQATDVSVNKATSVMFNVVNNPEDIVKLGVDGLIPYIQSIGLYKNKAKFIFELSKILIAKYQSQVPRSFENLCSLPGVGRKTANVVLNVAFNKPTIAVDTHVFRVSRRIGLSSANNVVLVEEDLLKNIPTKYLMIAHHLLILHGRYTCKAKKFNCKSCPINDLCIFYKTTPKS